MSRIPTLGASMAVAACLALLLAACGNDSNDAPPPAPPPPPLTNAAPTVRPGGNQSVVLGATVQLDGTASTDPDGSPLTYAWTLVARPTGSAAQLAGAATARPTFVADVAGSYTAALVVSDGTLSSATGLVTITAALGNVAPVARTGADVTTIPNATVTLDASASSDANGDPLTYRWTLTTRPTGSAAVLADASAVRTSFVPDVPGSYAATLVVNDGTFDSAPARLLATVVNANVPPVADAGPAQRVATGTAVTLDGRRSSDPNGDPLSYQWSLVSRPAGSTAALSARTGPTTGIVADVEGTFVVALVVNDGTSDSAAATVAINTFMLRPLPAGAGTYAQARGSLAFHALDDNNGASPVGPARPEVCARFVAADTLPDGVVLGIAGGATTLTLADVQAGVCKPHFVVAEAMVSLAVSAGGVVHALSQAGSGTGGARQLYRYAADGATLGRVALSGTGTAPGSTVVLTLSLPEAIDFAPDGSLLALQAGSVWQVDPLTGIGTLRAVGINGAGDIDIDATGQLRTLAGDRLYVYDTATWALLRSVALPAGGFGPSALVRR